MKTRDLEGCINKLWKGNLNFLQAKRRTRIDSGDMFQCSARVKLTVVSIAYSDHRLTGAY